MNRTLIQNRGNNYTPQEQSAYQEYIQGKPSQGLPFEPFLHEYRICYSVAATAERGDLEGFLASQSPSNWEVLKALILNKQIETNVDKEVMALACRQVLRGREEGRRAPIQDNYEAKRL